MENENLLLDIMTDLRNERKFIRKLCFIMCLIIVLLSFGIIGTSIYNQNKIFKFINETEFESSVEMSNENSVNYGAVISK